VKGVGKQLNVRTILEAALRHPDCCMVSLLHELVYGSSEGHEPCMVAVVLLGLSQETVPVPESVASPWWLLQPYVCLLIGLCDV
jgi:hypothetical protein